MQDYTRMFAGMDIGDRYSEICILDAQGEIVEQRRVASTESSLIKYFSPKLPITVAMETGFHSPWMSRALSALGAEVIVANARKVALIAKKALPEIMWVKFWASCPVCRDGSRLRT